MGIFLVESAKKKKKRDEKLSAQFWLTRFFLLHRLSFLGGARMSVLDFKTLDDEASWWREVTQFFLEREKTHSQKKKKRRSAFFPNFLGEIPALKTWVSVAFCIFFSPEKNASFLRFIHGHPRQDTTKATFHRDLKNVFMLWQEFSLRHVIV